MFVHPKKKHHSILTERASLNDKFILFSLILLAIVFRLYNILNYEINWDEFYYLSFVHQFLSDETINSFQTFHVHFFSWLRWVSENEVKQIIAARSVMLCLQVATGFFLFRICRNYFTCSASLFSVLAYFSFSFVIRMGASFRADPIATFCLMASLDYVLRVEYSLRQAFVASVLTAVAFLVTLKSVFYLPTLALIALLSILRSSNRRRTTVRYARYLIFSALAFSILYLWHSNSIANTTNHDIIAMIDGADKTLNHKVFFPRLSYFIYTLGTDIGFWFTLSCGVFYYLTSINNKTNIYKKIDNLKLITLIIPLTSLLIYRNAFPYFYSFMLAPACVFCGIAWDKWSQRENRKTYISISRGILLLFITNIVIQNIYQPFVKSLDYQYKLLEVVHKTFPKPVAYIDRCSMVSSYPQKGFFMSSWGMENYWLAEQPILELAIENHEPIFLIINSEYLEFVREDKPIETEYSPLLRRDMLAIENNYILHWNEIYVAGKVLVLTQENTSFTFTLNIPGDYTLESSSKVMINSETVLPQETITLSKGEHTIQISEEPGVYTLRWGNNLYRPEEVKRKSRVFNGF
jgi:hypothetical protein